MSVILSPFRRPKLLTIQLEDWRLATREDARVQDKIACAVAVKVIFVIGLWLNCWATLASEANVLESNISNRTVVSRVLRANKNLELDTAIATNEEERLFCRALFSEMRDNTSRIQYPEPAVKTNDVNNPVFDRYRYCNTDEHVDKYSTIPGYFFSIEDEIGTTNFRIYRLDIDGISKNGLEEILYGERNKEWMGTPNPTADRVFALISIEENACRYARAVVSPTPRGPPWSLQSYGGLMRYEEKYYFYSLTGGYPHDHLSITRLSGIARYGEGPAKPIACAWSLKPGSR